MPLINRLITFHHGRNIFKFSLVTLSKDETHRLSASYFVSRVLLMIRMVINFHL